MINVNDLVETAVLETAHLNNNEMFLVRDLFKGYEWNRISRSDRLLLGTLFLNYVNTKCKDVIPVLKTSAGQQKYKKVEAQ